MAVTRFVAPGPEVPMHTPTLPVACANPSAAWPPTCSWRMRTVFGFSQRNSASYRGRIVPPGMPKRYSTPSASNALRTAIAPVIFSLAMILLVKRSRLGFQDLESSGGERRTSAPPLGRRRGPPLYPRLELRDRLLLRQEEPELVHAVHEAVPREPVDRERRADRKSTRLNS